LIAINNRYHVAELSMIMSVFQKLKTFKSDVTKGLSEFYSYMVTSLVEASEKCKDLKKTNLELAKFHLQHANFSDSIFRYWIVLNVFKVQNEKTYYNLALAYLLSNSRAKAINFFEKALKLNPKDKLCKFRLSALERPDLVTEIPQEILEEDYDIWASIFSRLVLEAKYIGPEILINEYRDFIAAHKKEELAIASAFDLGCGYGIAGYLASVNFNIEHLFGIDISNKMISKAKSLNDKEHTFEKFFHEDFMKFSGYQAKADLVIACHSLQFSNDLEPFLKKFKTISQKKAHLIFSVPLSKKKKTCYDENLRQFQYTITDVEKVLKAQNFKKIKLTSKQVSSQQEAIIAIVIK
jgi:predicted TPR repeat methyltransferase